MPAFLIADAFPHDPDAYRASGYLEAAVRIAGRHGGRYRVRGGEMTALEGEWDLRRAVIIEFPTMGDLRAFYDDPEYQEWIPVRQRLTDSRLLAVEGID
ncbi:MAG: DUF1330 domain-containing protein [Acidimicrobiia bacterium]